MLGAVVAALLLHFAVSVEPQPLFYLIEVCGVGRALSENCEGGCRLVTLLFMSSVIRGVIGLKQRNYKSVFSHHDYDCTIMQV